MKKVVLILIILLTFMVSSGMALDITLTIPTDKVTRIQAGFFTVFPNTECAVVNEDGVICDTPAYTNLQWFKEVLRRWVVRQARRGEQKLAAQTAIDALVNDFDGQVQ